MPHEAQEKLKTSENLFGWDPLPGIVSVWASRDGRAVVWRREDERILRVQDTFRPWLFATTLDDLIHLGSALVPFNAALSTDTSLISYRILDGSSGSYRYLLSARDGRFLERALLKGATQRLGRQIKNLGELASTYYQVGPVEQYLMQTGRVYFLGLKFEDLHRLQFDLETTSLDPHRGRIFLIAVRDSRGFAMTLEAPSPDDEAEMITKLCRIVRDRDPDVVENHNLATSEYSRSRDHGVSPAFVRRCHSRSGTNHAGTSHSSVALVFRLGLPAGPAAR